VENGLGYENIISQGGRWKLFSVDPSGEPRFQANSASNKHLHQYIYERAGYSVSCVPSGYYTEYED
jgi:hypothetical protein